MTSSRTEDLKAALQAQRAVKVIAGINNVDLNRVLPVVRAAEAAGATAVDVAATPEILQAVRQETALTVFASSISPEALAEAVAHGADVAELGNYDALYEDGLFLSEAEVLRLAQETHQRLQGRALLSVTIPGHLALDAQIRLAQALEALGVDMLQTEGAARILSAEPQVKTLSPEEKAAVTFANTRALVAAVSIPVITASGIQQENLQTAFAHGASAVGVGSAINRLEDEAAMTRALQAMMAVVDNLPATQELAQAS